MKYLPFLTLGVTTGVSHVFLPMIGDLDEGGSDNISIPDGFPFGDSIQTTVYVSATTAYTDTSVMFSSAAITLMGVA